MNLPPVKLWIDDLRPAPAGWTWVKTSADALVVVRSGLVQEISFDHDLGGDDTAMPVARFIEELAYARTGTATLHHSLGQPGRAHEPGSLPQECDAVLE